MNKPVEPWTGTKGLHKEKISEEINKKHKMEKKMKKSKMPSMKHSKEDLHEAAKHMKKHGG